MKNSLRRIKLINLNLNENVAKHSTNQEGFSGFHDRPVKKSVNHLRTLPNTRKRENNVRKPKHVYLLLAIINESSETIRTKGMKDQLCAIFLASVVPFLAACTGFAAVSGENKTEDFIFLW